MPYEIKTHLDGNVQMYHTYFQYPLDSVHVDENEYRSNKIQIHKMYFWPIYMNRPQLL